jgi:hypothetical protein
MTGVRVAFFREILVDGARRAGLHYNPTVKPLPFTLFMLLGRSSAVTFWPVARRGLLFALIAAAGCLLIADESQAGCSHYVKKLGPGFVPGKVRVAGLVNQPTELAAVPRPCSGPECQGIPPAHSPASPLLPVPKSTQEWALLALHSDSTNSAAGSWDRDSLTVRPLAGYRQLPDRPPNG